MARGNSAAIPVGPCRITFDGDDVGNQHDIQVCEVEPIWDVKQLLSTDWGENAPIGAVEGSMGIKVRFGGVDWDQTKALAYMPGSTASGSYIATFGREPGTALNTGELVLYTVYGEQDWKVTVYKGYAETITNFVAATGEAIPYGVQVTGMIDITNSSGDYLWSLDLTAAVTTAPGPPTTTTPESDTDVAINTTVVLTFGSDTYDAIRTEYLTSGFFTLIDNTNEAIKACTITYDSTRKVVTMTPTANLENSADHSIIVSTEILNDSNVPLAATYVDTFLTVDAE